MVSRPWKPISRGGYRRICGRGGQSNACGLLPNVRATRTNFFGENFSSSNEQHIYFSSVLSFAENSERSSRTLLDSLGLELVATNIIGSFVVYFLRNRARSTTAIKIPPEDNSYFDIFLPPRCICRAPSKNQRHKLYFSTIINRIYLSSPSIFILKLPTFY